MEALEALAEKKIPRLSCQRCPKGPGEAEYTYREWHGATEAEFCTVCLGCAVGLLAEYTKRFFAHAGAEPPKMFARIERWERTEKGLTCNYVNFGK